MPEFDLSSSLEDGNSSLWDVHTRTQAAGFTPNSMPYMPMNVMGVPSTVDASGAPYMPQYLQVPSGMMMMPMDGQMPMAMSMAMPAQGPGEAVPMQDSTKGQKPSSRRYSAMTGNM